jgi:hypothetical protein
MSEAPRRYLRFRWPDRAEHIVLLGSFTILAVTGLVQKFAEAGVSQAIIAALGGIEPTRTIHHAAAVVLMLEGIFHLGRCPTGRCGGAPRHALGPLTTRASRLPPQPGPRRDPPLGGRYTFAEKAEYLPSSGARC